MKIVVTGSLGYVSTPLIQDLVKRGHLVTVISSNAEKQTAIEALGAKAAIGTMEDAGFLTETFTGADAVYCMLAPYGNFADPDNNADAVARRADLVASNYVQAIEHSGVKRVVYLSSVSADMENGNGLIAIHHRAEKMLSTLPADVSISFIRPGGFYKNLLLFVNMIKTEGRIAAGYGGDDPTLLVSNIDIADAIVQELESQAAGRRVRYVASEALTYNEVAATLGAAIGKPDLKWDLLTDEQEFNRYKAIGMGDSFARKFVEMNASIHSGRFYEDYNRHKTISGKIKLKQFAEEFAAVYNQQ